MAHHEPPTLKKSLTPRGSGVKMTALIMKEIMGMDITNVPKMMTVRQIASTGILPENTIRVMLKRGDLPAIYSGNTAYINFDLMCEQLRNLKPGNVS